MEKHVAELLKIQNPKVRYQSHIHNDIAFSILSKLSIKSLKRFGCVCKSWSLLFDDPTFMTVYRNTFLSNDHPYYNDKSILLYQTIFPDNEYGRGQDTFKLYSVSEERFENRVQLNWPKVTLNESNCDSGFLILGPVSVNGTLCLTCAYLENLALWNPSTKEFKVIPPSPLHSSVCVNYIGFGYDSVRDDFKVLRHLHVFQETNMLSWKDKSIWEIYSVRNNSWKKLDVDMYHDQMLSELLYIDGLSHWLCKTKRYNKKYLLSFDWSNEVFLTTPLPSDMEDIISFPVKSHLVLLLNGSIALIMIDKKTGGLHILILGELGVKESWIKIFNVMPLTSFRWLIGVGKGRLLFETEGDHLAWFDLNTQMIEDVDLSTKKFHFRILFHKENLVPFPFEG